MTDIGTLEKVREIFKKDRFATVGILLRSNFAINKS